MPRAFAKVNVAIWQDPDFRSLPPAAQHLYLLLWTAPELSFCGVHDWRPGRLSHLSAGFTEDHTRAVADCLVARHFLVTDDETEEVLIRSWVRFDEVLKQPRLAVSYVNAYNATYSSSIRSVLVYEAHKMRKLWPDLACWRDERVLSVLDHEAISAKDLPAPQDPFGDGFTPRFGDGFGLGLGQTEGKVWGSVSVPPTTATTTTTNRQQPALDTSGDGKSSQSRKRPATKLPEDWTPNPKHREREADGIDVDLEAQAFRLHAEANDRRQASWDAAFSQWLLKARPSATRPSPVARLPHVSELETPPNGLSDEEYDQWLREHQQ